MGQKRRRVKQWYWGIGTGEDSIEGGKGFRKRSMKSASLPISLTDPGLRLSVMRV